MHGDGLSDYCEGPVDLILCNPPFHLGNTVDEMAGQHLLRQAADAIKQSGQLCLVANRQLASYMPLLRRTFKRVDKVSANHKFNVYLAQQPTHKSPQRPSH